MAETSPASTLHCIVVTPEETVLEGKASFVALPLFDGEVGIARNHSPMIGRLGFGEMRIRSGNETTHYYVDGGFVQVDDNQVSVLTNRAIPIDAVDAEAAQLQLTDALGRAAAGDEEIAIRDRLLSQSRAQLRIAPQAK